MNGNKQIITSVATEQGQGVQDFIIMSAYEKALQLTQQKQTPQLVSDFFLSLEPLSVFKDIDPVAYQKAVRD